MGASSSHDNHFQSSDEHSKATVTLRGIKTSVRSVGDRVSGAANHDFSLAYGNVKKMLNFILVQLLKIERQFFPYSSSWTLLSWPP